MMVLILHKIRPGVRGRLTRWLIQPQSNVYVGHPSARIREVIWKHICDEIDTRGGSAVLIHTDPSEQGYRIATRGETPKTTRDFDGLILPKAAKAR
ncbi:MAG: type I-E CRISPR-associated endoribonuclease Cas2 [Phycisphaerales bacterium]|nr:type I-E CRISPR-associated endoribonuclease Cas2 [Phycisphaerales bacterium]